jgi:2-methylcitrate dehydratase PrpD
VCVVFAATAAVAKVLHLTESETRNALAFNKCGGSFQSNVDGSLAVRVIEGWVAESGVTCARFARQGITGPANFLQGIYGYFHLFGRDRLSGDAVTSGLGTEYKLQRVIFKKYLSCGLTQGCTDVILNLMREQNLDPDHVAHRGYRATLYLQIGRASFPDWEQYEGQRPVQHPLLSCQCLAS